MKFKCLHSILLVLVSFLNVQAQAKLKGDLMINAGIARCDHFDKLYDIGLSSDAKIVHEKQVGITLINFNLIYFFRSEKFKLQPLVGVSFIPQGFWEKGYTMDSLTKVPYEYAFKLSYTSLFAGLKYQALETEKLTVNICQMLMPMLRSDNVAYMKTIALSTRTEFFFKLKIKKQWKFNPLTLFSNRIDQV